MTDLDRYTSPRLNPSQARGKERIRLILTTALRLFRDKGIDQTTTNDIAKAAHIPIGSVYRYFQNKEEIILSIAELQIEDVSILFEDINQRPDLRDLSWAEIIALIVETWSRHARNNDSFAYLYFVRSNADLLAKAASRWHQVHLAYKAILQTRDPRIQDETVGVYAQLTWSAVELAIATDDDTAQKAASILAEHLDRQYPS